MKKIFLLSATGLLGFAAVAQRADLSVVRANDAVNAMQRTAAPFDATTKIDATRRNTAKTAATPFYTETFGSGTPTAFPTGWTATKPSNLNGNWKWTNVAARGSFSIGAINSTSRADGWMIYDSDSIGDLHPTTLPITGSLISPSINCSAHSSVLLSFQSYFRKFRDSTYVDVSNDGGVTYTAYPVQANNTMNDNTTNSSNPTLVRINISLTAQGQSNVRIRFRYEDNVYVGGTFNWLVDDVTLSEVDPVELGIANSGMYQYNGAGNLYSSFSLFSTIPVQLVDSLLPVTRLTNNGLSAQSNIAHTVRVFQGATQVYSQTQNFASIPANANPLFTDIDSIVDWSSVPNYKPTSIGSYTAAFSINPTNDAFTANNTDTTRFSVNDTVYATYAVSPTTGQPVTAGNYFLHRSSATAAGELSIQLGSRFDIPAGRRDTLTSVSVAFASGTSVGVNTTVQIYKIKGSSSSSLIWDPVGTVRTKVLAAGDISGTSLVWTNYAINPAVSSQFILDSGSYVAVVKTIGAPSTATVLLTAGQAVNADPGVGGYYGHYDTAENAAAFSFAATSGIRTGITAVPLLRANFGNKVQQGSGSVANIAGVTIGNAFPNPANNTLSIPVAVTTGHTINISLSNMVGQVLKTQALGTMSAGQSKTAVFNTSELAPGMYLYTIESDGARVTNRVVVAH